jgi:type IV pilus assembly protein PilW
MKTKQHLMQNQSGFTLVELLIAMVVALLVSAAIFASYKVQQQTHKAQMQVTEIQQNLRAAMEMMSREFKMVGYDPTYTGEYGITVATATNFQFTADLCDNGDDPKAVAVPLCPAPGKYAGQNLDETYNYRIFGTRDLVRTPADSPIAHNIEFIEFYYILEDGTGRPAPSADEIVDVRSVRVTIVARAAEPDFKYTDTNTYPLGSGAPSLGPYGDNFRRRSLIRTIELRNTGII